MGMLDFLSGVGATGAQIGMDAIKSQVEEEKAMRLAEMANRFQTSRDATLSGQRVAEHAANAAVDTAEAPARERARADAAIRVAKESPRNVAEGTTEVIGGVPTFTAPKTGNPDTDKTLASHERIAREANATHERIAEKQLGGMTSVQTDATTGGLYGITRDGKTIPITNPDGSQLMGQKNLPAGAAKMVDVLNDQVKAIDKHIADSMLTPEVKADLERRRAALNVQILGTLTGGGFTDRFQGGGKPSAPKQGGEAAVTPARPTKATPAENARMLILQDELSAEQEKLADYRRKNDRANIERSEANIASLEREIGGTARKPKAEPKREPEGGMIAPKPAPENFEFIGEKLEATDPELKRLGNMMRLTEGGSAAAARAAYLQRVRELQGRAPSRSAAIAPEVAAGLINAGVR